MYRSAAESERLADERTAVEYEGREERVCEAEAEYETCQARPRRRLMGPIDTVWLDLQVYSLHSFAHLTHRKKLVMGSSADRIWSW